MPPRPLPVDVARWTLRGFLFGFVPWRIDLHLLMQPSSVPDVSDLSVVHNDLVTFFLFFWGSVVTTDANLALSRLEWESGFGRLVDEDRPEAPGHQHGTDANNVAVCFTWHTQEGGRGHFGRSFFAGIPNDCYTEGGLLQSPPASTWQDNANDFLANVNSITTTAFPSVVLVVIERQRDRIYLDHPAIHPVQGVRLSPRIASQVRRLKHIKIV